MIAFILNSQTFFQQKLYIFIKYLWNIFLNWKQNQYNIHFYFWLLNKTNQFFINTVFYKQNLKKWFKNETFRITEFTNNSFKNSNFLFIKIKFIIWMNFWIDFWIKPKLKLVIVLIWTFLIKSLIKEYKAMNKSKSFWVKIRIKYWIFESIH